MNIQESGQSQRLAITEVRGQITAGRTTRDGVLVNARTSPSHQAEPLPLINGEPVTSMAAAIAAAVTAAAMPAA